MDKTQTWEHMGVTITLDVGDTRVRFEAKVKDKPLHAPSLEAIKKQIEKALDETSKFKPFKALRFSGGYREKSKVVEYNVTGLRRRDARERRSSYTSSMYEFISENDYRGHSTEYFVYRSTPEMLKAMKAHVELEAKNKAEVERLNKEVEDSKRALKHLSADDVGTGKVKL